MNKKLKADILAECKYDYVHLRYLLGILSEYYDDKFNMQKNALNVIKELLEEQLMVAGVPVRDGGEFFAWKDSIDVIINKIKKEWDALGREPIMWEIVWFNITPRGEKELEKLLKIINLKHED